MNVLVQRWNVGATLISVREKPALSVAASLSASIGLTGAVPASTSGESVHRLFPGQNRTATQPTCVNTNLHDCARLMAPFLVFGTCRQCKGSSRSPFLADHRNSALPSPSPDSTCLLNSYLEFFHVSICFLGTSRPTESRVTETPCGALGHSARSNCLPAFPEGFPRYGSAEPWPLSQLGPPCHPSIPPTWKQPTCAYSTSSPTRRPWAPK